MDLLKSLPLGLYLEQPLTWLHRIDPRVKFIWLMSFLTTYLFANNLWRLLLVALLMIITVFARIPLRVWRQQMGWLLILGFLVFSIISLSPDALGVSYQPRLPENQQAFNPTPANAQSNQNSNFQDIGNKSYSYVLFTAGPVKVTRRTFDLGIKVSTLLFTVLYSTTLYLLTTAPEEITAALGNLMQPLKKLKVPVTEITLTLTLSLRFIPLVLEEIQNLIRSIMTRAINWKKLGFKGTVKVWIMVAERLLENLLLRAEQMASAMMVRGFTSPNEHQVQWNELRFRSRDWLAIAILFLFWGVRIAIGTEID